MLLTRTGATSIVATLTGCGAGLSLRRETEARQRGQVESDGARGGGLAIAALVRIIGSLG